MRAALVLCLFYLAGSAAPARAGGLDAPTLDSVIAAIFADAADPRFDINADGRVGAADATATIRGSIAPTPAFSPTETPATATATAPETPTNVPTGPDFSPSTTATAPAPDTPTPSATASRTPARPCPTAGAEAILVLDDRRSEPPPALRMSGHVTAPACANTSGLLESYSLDDVENGATAARLVPGRWVHTLESDGGQRQHRPGLLVAGSGRNAIRFTAFASVRTVNTAADTDDEGSLRWALANAAADSKPLLIQFSEQAFPTGTQSTILLRGALPALASSEVTIDGTDADGASGRRTLDADRLPIPVLSITGAANSIVGLRLRNSGDNNRDVLSISGGGARRNTIERCTVESAASADAIGVGAGAGIDLEITANVVRDSEIFNASDKGIKATTGGHVRVEGCHVHDNGNGGIQATLSGHVWARDNLVERSGGASAQNGISANGADAATPWEPSELRSEGNIVRFNAANGISVRGYSIALIRNDYLAANGSSGLRVFDQGIAPTSVAVVEGTTAACNQFNGAVVADSASADFGGGPLGSPGNNAFTQTNDSDANLRNSTSETVFALYNQWEHCGSATVCDEAAIAAHDLSDHGARTLFSPPRAHRLQQAPSVTRVSPSKAMEGDLVRVFGSGFNAIDAHATGEPCADLSVRNRCSPTVRGNCVRVGGVPAALEGVTPTMLVVRMPFSCVAPVTLTVQTQGGGTSAGVTLCTSE